MASDTNTISCKKCLNQECTPKYQKDASLFSSTYDRRDQSQKMPHRCLSWISVDLSAHSLVRFHSSHYHPTLQLFYSQHVSHQLDSHHSAQQTSPYFPSDACGWRTQEAQGPKPDWKAQSLQWVQIQAPSCNKPPIHALCCLLSKWLWFSWLVTEANWPPLFLANFFRLKPVVCVVAPEVAVVRPPSLSQPGRQEKTQDP